MNPSSPTLNFSGPTIALGPLRADLLPLYNKWNNDFVINATTSTMRPVTLAQDAAAYPEYSKRPDFVFFTIYEKATLDPIGFSFLMDIKNQTAEFAILIGERDKHGRGYGTETTRLVLDYAFNVLNLHNVMLRVDAFNEAGIRAYTKAGFKEFGRRREVKRLLGARYDLIFMDILADEFEGGVLGEILGRD